MRIDLANLIAAQSSRPAPVKPPPEWDTFASELKPIARPEPVARPEAEPAKEPPPAPRERSATQDQPREAPAPRPRPGSQIDIKV